MPTWGLFHVWQGHQPWRCGVTGGQQCGCWQDQSVCGITTRRPLRGHVDTRCVQSCARSLASLGSLHQRRRDLVIMRRHNRSTGDALGPLVGSRLADRRVIREHSSHGHSGKPYMQATCRSHCDLGRNNHAESQVDACLGKLESVGYITVLKARRPEPKQGSAFG